MLFKNFALVAMLVAFALNVTEAQARKNPWVPKDPEQTQPAPQQGNDKIPTCVDADRRPIQGNNNDEVIRWKTTTKNQYLDRALVTGKFVKFLNNKTDHLHFDIELDAKGDGRSDTSNHLEVVYNREFGDIANIRPGAVVIACGDFINSFAQAGRYPPSPVGAIIHWVHQSNNTGKHAHGFLMIDGTVYGDEGDALTGDSRNKGGNPAGNGQYDRQNQNQNRNQDNQGRGRGGKWQNWKDWQNQQDDEQDNGDDNGAQSFFQTLVSMAG